MSSDELTTKRKWVRENRGVLTKIAEDARHAGHRCTRQFVYQVFYFSVPSRDGRIEALLLKYGAPFMDRRRKGVTP